VLTGGLGRDVLKGGNGSDRFDFNLVVESPRGLLRDNVIGFSGAGGQGDKIDLSTVDANLTDAGNQAFASGQLSYRDGVLTADVKGGADLQIQLIGSTLFNLAVDVIG
jgi:Ca2+-binding RTX toxin-like protein